MLEVLEILVEIVEATELFTDAAIWIEYFVFWQHFKHL